jgi:hypothetical protein
MACHVIHVVTRHLLHTITLLLYVMIRYGGTLVETQNLETLDQILTRQHEGRDTSS